MSPSLTMTSTATSESHLLAPQATLTHTRRSSSQRPLSSHSSKCRLSDYSLNSAPTRSQSYSHTLPGTLPFQPYTVIRDFAYSTSHPMHRGPMANSLTHPGLSALAYEKAEFLNELRPWDPIICWGPGPNEKDHSSEESIDPIKLDDGPPWSEDEDLQSPVVVCSRRRKQKLSGSSSGGRGRSTKEAGDKIKNVNEQSGCHDDGRRFSGSSGHECDRYYVRQGDEMPGPEDSLVAYPSDETRHFDIYNISGHRDSHFAGTLPSQSYVHDGINDFSGSETPNTPSSQGSTPREESRYSRDYQFTITSSDEEMHGQAVALFDFARENENELPLIEGQVILVSYRHGQGWLVAEDPKTQESGLVPESYVRLLRDIHEEFNSNTTNMQDPLNSFHNSIRQSSTDCGHVSAKLSNGYDYESPIVSTFSTSSKDLHPYPHYLLGTLAGQAPPRVIHYQGQCGGSQMNTPTNLSPIDNISDINSNGSPCVTPTTSALSPVTRPNPSRSVELTNIPQNGSNTWQRE